MSKKWEKPQLVILYRARSEEAALSDNCKHLNLAFIKANSDKNYCNGPVSPGGSGCGFCQNNANQS